MVENDTFTYHVKKPLIDQKNGVISCLITQERTRKLELLIHLITNSRQALVVCGPEGIGKSTMLKVLQERKIDSWLYCLVHGSADLSFEQICEQTAELVWRGNLSPQVQVLSGAFNRLESQPKKIILMIDEAGQLTPGLIDRVIEYAAKNPLLRVIFALSNDDLYEKNSSDSAIDGCHLIEIPPLTEKQCGEFIQYLAKKKRREIAFSEISDDLVASVYGETQGIPGRIITESPALEDSRQTDNSLWILVASVAGLIVLALCIQWYSGSEYNIKPIPKPVPDVQKPVSLESGVKIERL